MPVDTTVPPAPEIPKGNSRITGTITAPVTGGMFGAVLFPANSAPLTALNPCFPDQTTSSDIVGPSRKFEFRDIAPGNYIVIAYRVDAISPRAFERTTKLVTVAGVDADVGPITLPSPVVSTEMEMGEQDLVQWSAPPSLVAGATGFAFRITDRNANACTPGTEVTVATATNGFQIPEDDQRVRIGLYWPTAGQMAIKVIQDSDGRPRPR